MEVHLLAAIQALHSLLRILIGGEGDEGVATRPSGFAVGGDGLGLEC
jgi:hypothetical protein